MRQSITWFWQRGILSTFLAGLFALLPIVITIGIIVWAGELLKEWLGPQSFVGQALSQMGLRFVTDPTVASVLSWVAVLLAVWLLGALLKSVGKRRIERAFHAAMERIPLVNVLYGPVAQVVYVPTSPLPMSGLIVFAAADSVQQVEMKVDDLMKICLSIGVMSSKVIPDQYVVPLSELERARNRLINTITQE